MDEGIDAGSGDGRVMFQIETNIECRVRISVFRGAAFDKVNQRVSFRFSNVRIRPDVIAAVEHGIGLAALGVTSLKVVEKRVDA
jgi:hypothetical protein